jgi:hypothetical protein
MIHHVSIPAREPRHVENRGLYRELQEREAKIRIRVYKASEHHAESR